MLQGKEALKMSSVYNLLRESCGLSQAEAADFVHEVRLDTVKSWSSDRRPAPQFAVNQLQSLLRTIGEAGEQFAKDLKMRSQGNVFIIGHAHDDDDARVCGFPSLSTQMHSIAIAISLYLTTLRSALRLVSEAPSPPQSWRRKK